MKNNTNAGRNISSPAKKNDSMAKRHLPATDNDIRINRPEKSRTNNTTNTQSLTVPELNDIRIKADEDRPE